MSRHRNVRSMNYDEEYEGYDDVYGHSVEDDFATSPSMEHFMYDRDREQQMSSFLTTEADIMEEEEPEQAEKAKESLSEADQARLLSCLDHIRDIMGDSIAEGQIIKSIIVHNFDTASVMSALLDMPAAKDPPTKIDNLLEASGTVRPLAEEPIFPLQKKAGRVVLELPKLVTPIKTVQANAKPAVKTGFLLPPSQDSLAPTLTASTDVSPAPSVSASRSTSPSFVGTDTPSKSSSKREKPALDVEAEYERERGGGKQLLNMVVVGHVDAGKSTMMGHLLYRLGQVSKKMMHKYEQESKKLGKQSFMYAWVLDETGEERSRGITMDVAQTEFQTSSKRVTLLDAPGHKDFIPNMITGAAQADVAMLVVDATSGEFETGFEFGGQTREHAILVRSLGVSQLGVAVNKLDTCNWSEERFKEIISRLKNFLKQVGFREADITYVPVSGLTGENLTTPPTEPALTSWYQGPTLVEVIDQFRAPERAFTKPVRLVISDSFKGAGTGGVCVAGRLESGRIAAGDKLTLMPQGETALIKSLLVHDLSSLTAFAGDQVVLTIAGVDPLAINVGGVLCDPSHPIKTATRIEARIVLFNIEIPITKGYPVVLHYQSLSEPAFVKKIKTEIHKGTGEIVKSRPRCLLKNTSAIVELEVGRPICMELYRDFRELGRFMLRSTGSTIAAGVVTKIF